MASSEIKIRVPHPSGALVSNLLGVLGLVAVVCAVGGLAGWWWALGAAGVFSVALSVIGSAWAEQGVAIHDAPRPAVAAVPAVAKSA